jgi:amino-acid N-acetyltransferase
MSDACQRGAPRLKKTDDFEAIRKLALASGLEDGTFENIVAAFGYYIGEELMGCVALKRDGDRHSVEWLSVAESLRHKGIGSILVANVEAEARMRGAEKLWALARAPQFFEKIGFRITTPEESGGPTMSNCLLCSQYQKSCFPAIVVKDF